MADFRKEVADANDITVVYVYVASVPFPSVLVLVHCATPLRKLWSLYFALDACLLVLSLENS